MRRTLLIGLLVVIAAVTAIVVAERDRTEELVEPVAEGTEEPATETIATGLEVPWELAWLPDGRMLVTERPGRVRVIKDGRLEPEPLLTVTTVERGEGGLQGMAIDPEYAQNKFVYLYVSEAAGGRITNKVVRYRDDGSRLVEPRTIIDGIPGNSNHNGGRIAFGPDKFLYVTTGDAQAPESAQDQDGLAGKILRVNADGSAAGDNPFGNRTWSYGHRNPQGLAWDAEGRLFETEHGPSGERALCCRDEVNLIRRGGNYGWPTITGTQERFGLGSPLVSSGDNATWAPGGGAFGPDGRFWFATLRGEHLHVLILDGDRVSDQKEFFNDTYGRLRTATFGPDGKLYVLTSNRDGRGTVRDGDDKILRLNRLPD